MAHSHAILTMCVMRVRTCSSLRFFALRSPPRNRNREICDECESACDLICDAEISCSQRTQRMRDGATDVADKAGTVACAATVSESSASILRACVRFSKCSMVLPPPPLPLLLATGAPETVFDATAVAAVSAAMANGGGGGKAATDIMLERGGPAGAGGPPR